MIGQDVLFSRKSNDWETPFFLFEKLNAVYNFDIDVCCTDQEKDRNKKCEIGITKEDDGLIQNWKTFYEEKKFPDGDCLVHPSTSLTAWMNPPYKNIKLWLSKAIVMAMDENISTICLLPARTDTKWFHDFLYSNPRVSYISDIRFLKGRLKFVGAESWAPFPSMLVAISSLDSAENRLANIHSVDLDKVEK